MIKISDNDASGIIKGVLRVFKQHTMFLLIEKIFFVIPFKAGLWHFILPYNCMGPYNTDALLVNEGSFRDAVQGNLLQQKSL